MFTFRTTSGRGNVRLWDRDQGKELSELEWADVFLHVERLGDGVIWFGVAPMRSLEEEDGDDEDFVVLSKVRVLLREESEGG